LVAREALPWGFAFAPEAQMRQIEPYFPLSHGVPGWMTAGDQRDCFCDPQWLALA